MTTATFRRQFSRFRQLVQRAGDQPFESFREGLPWKWEHYKEYVRSEAQRRLRWRDWHRSDIGRGQILKRALEAIEIGEQQSDEPAPPCEQCDEVHHNNLVRWPARYGPAAQSHRKLRDARSNLASRREFEKWFFDFFNGRSRDEEAFSTFCELAGRRYDLVAYLFFLKDWTRFMPIAPATFDEAFRRLGVNLVTGKRCSWENYQEYNDALRGLQRRLRQQALDARLIDAHSFCWMLVRLTQERAVAERGRHRRAEYQALAELEALDRRAEVLRRAEQGILRRHVLQGRASGKCRLCGKEFPAQFLVAAHIKPRSECSVDERRDWKNVVAMCRFGCDELFERGFAYVADGRVRATPGGLNGATSAVKAYLNLLAGRPCDSWSESSSFFRWHATHRLSKDDMPR